MGDRTGVSGATTSRRCAVCKLPENVMSESAIDPGGVVECGSRRLWVCGTHRQAFALGRQVGQAEALLDAGPARRPATTASSRSVQTLGPTPSPREICEVLDRTVVGQEAAKRQISLAVHKHYVRIGSHTAGPVPDPHHILLLGSSGSGKSLIAATIGSGLQVPYIAQDATVFTPTGFHGRDVSTMPLDLIEPARGDASLASRGVIFLDEVDKLASRDESSFSGFVRATQSALLRLVEGKRVSPEPRNAASAPYPRGKEVDTATILFLFGGAFTGLDEIVARRSGVRKPSIGLRCAPAEAQAEAHGLLAGAGHGVLLESLEEYGMAPELLGRIPSIVPLAPLTVEELRQILVCMDHSPLVRARALLAGHGHRLSFTEAFVDAVAERTHSMATGARGLSLLVNHAVSGAAFDLIGTEPNGGQFVEIDVPTLADPWRYRVLVGTENDEADPAIGPAAAHHP